MEALLYMYVLIVYTRLISGVTISDVGTDLVWSDDHELDMRGHCSFTFSVGFCGAFRLELYPEKSLGLPKYEIFIDRDSLNLYQNGIKKYCDSARLLCTNNGMGTSGHERSPLITCDGSTWTPFWISWNEATINLGKGDTVGKLILKQVLDPEFTHVDYVKMGADDTNTTAHFRFKRRTGRPDNPDMTCREKATTTSTTTAAISQSTTTLNAGSDPSAVAIGSSPVTISDVGTDLVWSDDHGLDMRGHCSFTFSVGFCGAFKLELYPGKNLSLPKYEIFIDRDSLNKYQLGIKKHCDSARLLCTNDGMGTSGHGSAPLVTCDGSTWTSFWISWNEATISLGRGGTVETLVLAQVRDPEFKHIDYVKMGADDTNTSANFRFEPRTGRPDNPDMACREKGTTDAAITPASATTQTDVSTAAASTAATTTKKHGPAVHAMAIPGSFIAIPAGATTQRDVAITAAATTTAATTTKKHGMEIPESATTRTDATTTTTTRAEIAGLEKAATATTTTHPIEIDVRMNVDNCDNARRPESENLGMVFEKAADDTTLSPSNPDVDSLESATSGSCAELCASRQTCVLYTISNTGTCRITSACRPQVESETGSTVLFLKYWG